MIGVVEREKLVRVWVTQRDIVEKRAERIKGTAVSKSQRNKKRRY
jgi:hypothetical protein